MKSRLVPISLFFLAAAALVSGVALGQDSGQLPAIQAPDALSPGFTYQGELKSGGSAVDGNCDFRFSLWNAASGGSQIGSNQTITNVSVTSGRFTVILNNSNQFGSTPFGVDDRWLKVEVRCPAGSGSYSTLSPRQKLTGLPHTHAGQNWTGTGTYGLRANTSGTYGLFGSSTATTGTRYGVYGSSSSTSGYGVYGTSSHNGVRGVSTTSTFLEGGVVGHNPVSSSTGIGSGVVGESDAGQGRGVVGQANHTSGSNFGVFGKTFSTIGTGVLGWINTSSAGSLAYAVWGFSDSASAYAGYFNGRVNVTGNLTKGGGAFKIDHPLEPEDKYLYHSFVESPDMMNIYNGNVVLDANGEAWVELADWFESLNMEFRYQLTAIGAPGPNLYIAQKIEGNRFKIAGGEAGMEVSWQVTGIRNDPFAQANRIPVEEEKPAEEQGTYLHADAYGQPQELGLGYQNRPDAEYSDER